MVGSVKLSSGDHYPVEAIWKHEDFNEETSENNIAVIKLSKEIDFTNSNVAVIPLSASSVPGNIKAVMTGWGTLNINENQPVENLQVLRTITLDNEDCAELSEPNAVQATEICTLKNEAGACRGDSGDPLAAGSQLIGLLSWGRPCARGLPDVYTRISSYANWITEKINA